MTTDAQFRVVAAGPYVSFQDAGRFGRCRFGVPASGPMDRLAHATANLAVGNAPDATAIEVSRAGLTLHCDSGMVTLALVGGGFTLDHGATHHDCWQVVTVRAGDRISIRPGDSGSWAYLSIAGTIDVPTWLSHTATHALSGFGGGILASGGVVEVRSARADQERDGTIPHPRSSRSAEPTRVVLGPQLQHFTESATATLLGEEFEVTATSDRMGVRLSGPPIRLGDALSIPSEPILRGSIQVTGDGAATVLLADHQTTGGYPKIATVISSDLDAFAQRRPGETVRFTAISPTEALAVARARSTETSVYLDGVAEPGRTLEHRLMRNNLISWEAQTGPDDR